jgi:DNA invertase Pin-like site-specific DNA recombinase
MNSRPLAIYARVSTSEQSVENQIPHLRRLADARGQKVAQIYAENISATKHRPEFTAMMKAAHGGKIGTVLIWALDRLDRSMLGAMQTVLELDRLGVRVISLNEAWLDTSGPVRSLLVGVFGWISEQERVRVSERTKAGLDRARRRGVKLGRKGFDIDVNRARALRQQGKSYRKIATILGVSVGKVHESLVGRASVRQTPRNASSADPSFLRAS